MKKLLLSFVLIVFTLCPLTGAAFAKKFNKYIPEEYYLTKNLPQKPVIQKVKNEDGSYTQEYLEKAEAYNKALLNKLNDNYYKKHHINTTKINNKDGSSYNLIHYDEMNSHEINHEFFVNSLEL